MMFKPVTQEKDKKEEESGDGAAVQNWVYGKSLEEVMALQMVPDRVFTLINFNLCKLPCIYKIDLV